jgi:hypothetical protein
MLTAVSSARGPEVVTLSLQETTSAAMDRTLAMGANVAAMRGIAVEANHQSLSLVLALKSPEGCERTYEGSSSSTSRKCRGPK